jgi:hypothetical protein
MCVLNCLVRRMHLNNQLLCYAVYVLDKLLKASVPDCLFNGKHFTNTLSIVFLIIQKNYRDHPYTVGLLSQLFNRNLQSITNVEFNY